MKKACMDSAYNVPFYPSVSLQSKVYFVEYVVDMDWTPGCIERVREERKRF